MIRIAVCDDEIWYCQKIEKIISGYCLAKEIDFEIVLFRSGEEFVALGKEMNRFQIVYLDINMDGINGVETAEMLRKWCRDTYIVFVTAFIHYTLAGYKVEAIRYILKDNRTLEENIIESLNVIFEKMHFSASVQEYSFKEGVCSLSPNQIVMVESKLHNLYFTIKTQYEVKVFTMTAKLDDIEKRLQGKDFVRIHQSFLINIEFVKEVSNYQVRLWNDEILPVARPRYKDVKKQFLFHKGEL